MGTKAGKQRFKVREFINPMTKTTSWHVGGYKRDGSRVRENFSTPEEARCRTIELETEYLQTEQPITVQATELRPDQLRLAETAFNQLGDDWPRILEAVGHWKTSPQRNATGNSPRIDEAVDQYLVWLAGSSLREATRRHWKIRMTIFRNSVANCRVSEISPEFIDSFLAGRKTTPGGRDTDRRAVSRFLSWCIERPRRWATSNACREVRVERGEVKPPEVLSLDACKKLLESAQAHKEGLLAPYVAVCLFGGLRPFEASRLTWSQVNLPDREIRMEASQTKTKRPRVVVIDKTLRAWLVAHKDKPFFPTNWRKEFDAVRAAAKITHWPNDILRHTAISHYFRRVGSYGQTAEWAGNSEAIIKAHYQGRVSTKETKKFWALKPRKGATK